MNLGWWWKKVWALSALQGFPDAMLRVAFELIFLWRGEVREWAISPRHASNAPKGGPVESIFDNVKAFEPRPPAVGDYAPVELYSDGCVNKH